MGEGAPYELGSQISDLKQKEYPQIREITQIKQRHLEGFASNLRTLCNLRMIGKSREVEASTG